MTCMKTYAERLAHAMECRQMTPGKDQTHLARLVGGGCSPQIVQHLLDPAKNARSSKYTPMLAKVLQCDAVWLATGKGPAPSPGNAQNPSLADTENATNVVPMAAEPAAQNWWPWSVSAERIAALPPDFFGRLDGYIEGRVEEYERAHSPHQTTTMGQRATKAPNQQQAA